LSQNPKLTVHDIAREEQVSAAYLYILLRLPWLASDITSTSREKSGEISQKTELLLRKDSNF